jgi:hypothetical protein
LQIFERVRLIRHGLVNKLTETTQRFFPKAAAGSEYTLPGDFATDPRWSDVLESLGETWAEEAAKQFAYVAVLFVELFWSKTLTK